MLSKVSVKLAIAASVCACSDGYQAESELDPFEPEQWTQSARLAHLNGLGQSSLSGVRWQYTFGRDRCTLVVERKPRFETATQQQVGMAGVTFRVARGADAGPVVVTSARAHEAPAEVFATRSRVDALRAEQLLKLLQRDCALLEPRQELAQ